MIEIEYIPISEVIPYSKNPRKNDQAVDIVAKSIQSYGFKNPIILDKNNIIIAGHTRLKAAQKLGLNEVPVIWADDFKFIGKFEEQWARIGNAVMPRFMYHISNHIALIMQWQSKTEEFK